MKRFEKGVEYKLFRQDNTLAERTAICTGINREVGKIRFEIIGSEKEDFYKMKVVVLNLKEDKHKEIEYATDINFKTYLSIYATDIK